MATPYTPSPAPAGPGTPLGYPNQPGQPGMPIIGTSYNESPVRTICPFCKAEVVTTTEYSRNWISYVLCCALFLSGCFCGCCFIPFFINGLSDIIHKCPSCNRQMGMYRRAC